MTLQLYNTEIVQKLICQCSPPRRHETRT
jgi:hypothetical protein